MFPRSHAHRQHGSHSRPGDWPRDWLKLISWAILTVACALVWTAVGATVWLILQ